MLENAAGDRSALQRFSLESGIAYLPVRSKRDEYLRGTDRVSARMAALRTTNGNVGEV